MENRQYGCNTLQNAGIAFLVGAVAGLAIGFLYAPRPGRETREVIREKADSIMEEARRRADDIVHQAKETAGRFRKKEEAGSSEAG